jgi:lysophospholipase L1-like esterase
VDTGAGVYRTTPDEIVQAGGGDLSLRTDLAANTGATLVGTASGQTVQEALDAVDDNFSDRARIEMLVTALAAGTARTIEAFGDSTMWGADANNGFAQVATPSPLQMQNCVNNWHGNSALTVVNRGIIGTTATQMIAGTDGSGSTFAAKAASSSASAMICNHGVNDAEGDYATTPEEYRTALEAFALTCRANDIVPILATPFPCLNYPAAPTGFGSRLRAENTARFAQVMRDVAENMNVILVDQFALFRARFDQGVDPVSTLIDGVHGTQASDHGAYIFAGNNLAMALLGGQAVTFDAPGRIAGLSGSFHRASNEVIYQAPTSRTGVVVGSAQATGNTMRIIFYVPPDAPEMDISIEMLCYAAGDSAIAVSIDGYARNPLRQYRPGWTTTFEFDEIYVARRIGAGFHLLYMQTTNTGAVNVGYIRSRPATVPLPYYGSPGRTDSALTPAMSITGAGVSLFDDFLVDWREDDLELEFKVKFAGSTGFVIGACTGTLTSGPAASQHIIVGVNGTDLTVWEADAQGGSFTSAMISNSIDYTAAEHTYRVKITSGGILSIAVDGAAPLATTFTLTHGYQSGLLGVWQFAGSGEFVIRDVKQILFSPNIPLLPI